MENNDKSERFNSIKTLLFLEIPKHVHHHTRAEIWALGSYIPLAACTCTPARVAQQSLNETGDPL